MDELAGLQAMSNSINGMPPVDPGLYQREVRGPATTDHSNFLDTLNKTLDQAQKVQGEADQKVSDLVNGRGEDVHNAMIAVEKADLSFQLVMQVRNKIIQAYQEISQMPF
jgi:flagellar hook-basal body complex protein FliE